MYAENSVCFRKHEICGYECHDGGIDFGGGCTDVLMCWCADGPLGR